MEPTLRQRLGRAAMRNAPFNRRTFNVFRFETNAAVVRALGRFSPTIRRKIRELHAQNHLKVTIGSGGKGPSGWVNIDIGRGHADQTLPWDIRRSLPFRDGQVAALVAEHVVEHIEFREDVPKLFAEAHRVIENGGRFRIVVPDAERWVRAYASGKDEDWASLGISKLPEDMPTRMAFINHVFHQDGEHQFGWDFETLELVLKRAGFDEVERLAYGKSGIEGPSTDQPNHEPYSLYVEAIARYAQA